MTLSVGTPIIDAGLAKYEPDYYAILGVPLNADTRLIRKGYLNTAKRLHPDRYIGEPEKRVTANWLFSKLISPASEVLNREKDRIEYREVLRLRVKRLMSLPPADVWPQSHHADALLQATDLESTYRDTIINLADHQYSDLEKAVTCTGELSKVNLAYLLLSNGYKVTSEVTLASSTSEKAVIPVKKTTLTTPEPSEGSQQVHSHSSGYKASAHKTHAPRTSTTSSASGLSTENASTTFPPPEESNPIEKPGEKRFQQAKKMMQRKLYKEAIQYLNIAISTDPQNPDYFYERGLAYLKLNNAPRARQDFQKVLALSPEHPQALKKMATMGHSMGSQKTTAKATPANASSRSTPTEKKGVFGRLFNR